MKASAFRRWPVTAPYRGEQTTRFTGGHDLIWLDCRALGLSEEALENMIVHQAKLWLDRGAIFGKAGEGFERINIACPRSVLEDALKRLEIAVKALTV